MKTRENNHYNKVVFRTRKKDLAIISAESGNLKIEYKPKEKIYIISRTDNLTFNGTEDVGGIFCYTSKPQTIEEIIEHEVNVLTSIQKDTEITNFGEFDWCYNQNKTNILIYPVFLSKKLNIEVNISKTEIDNNTYFSKRKKIRKVVVN